MMGRKTVFTETQKAEIIQMYEETHSLRKTAAKFGVDHSTMSRYLKDQNVVVLSRNEAAQYTWKNNKHPRLGMTGEKCPVYGRKMAEETKEKIRKKSLERAAIVRYGRKKHSEGYIWVYSPEHPHARRDGYVLEHRLIMEESLGRILEKGEYVHHINGDKADNRIENLMVTNISEHAKIHMEMRYKKNA